MGTVRVMMQLGPGQLVQRELPRPPLTGNDAILQVEACGICGSDVDRFREDLPLPFPLIPGHEIIGIVEELGPGAAEIRNLRVGDRVAVDSIMSCGSCANCLGGVREVCLGDTSTYGGTSVDRAPSLWGGYASHVYVSPRTQVYPVAKHLDADIAALFNPLAAGIRWGVTATGVRPGSSLLVLGSGQRGLAVVACAKLAGASPIIVTGLGRDAHKLELARALGADVTVDVDRENVVDIARSLTGGIGVEAVVDTTPQAVQPVLDAISSVRDGGVIVAGGSKRRPLPAFPLDSVVHRGITLRGMKGVGSDAFRRALSILDEGRLPFERLRTHTFRIEDAEKAIRTLAGETGENAVNVVLRPA